MSTLLTWGLGASGAGPPVTGADLKQVIVSALEGEAALAAILGNRVYPSAIPQTGQLPALSYRFVSSTHDSHLRGAAGMKWVRVRFEARSTRHADLEAVKEILRNLFQGLIGTLGSVRIEFCILENEVDDYEEPIQGPDLGTHWKQFDLRFKLRESIPTNT